MLHFQYSGTTTLDVDLVLENGDIVRIIYSLYEQTQVAEI